MNRGDLITEVRFAAQIPDSDDDYTDARIALELDRAQQEIFAPILVEMKSGLLMKRFIQATASGTAVYRMPPRSIALGAEKMELYDSSGVYTQLDCIQPGDTAKYESTSTGRPRAYVLQGSTVRLFPTPDGVYTLRTLYYLRPSRLVQEQTAGIITTYTTGVSFELADNPLNRDTGAVIPASTLTYVDILRPGSTNADYGMPGPGSYEAVAVNVRVLRVGGFSTTYTINSTTELDLSEVAAGDFLRVADQAEWPMLPHEFHTTLAHAAAARICIHIGRDATAKRLGDLVQGGLQRLRSTIAPRVRADAPAISLDAHMIGRRW